jgi:hypothetical protein
MNPFQRQSAGRKRSSDFVEHVYDEVSIMQIGESKKIDLKGRSDQNFRVTLRHVSAKRMLFSKFKTKVDEAGSMWVMRVS